MDSSFVVRKRRGRRVASKQDRVEYEEGDEGRVGGTREGASGGQLSVEEIERLRDYEADTKNRKQLMERFEKRIRAVRTVSTTGKGKEGD